MFSFSRYTEQETVLEDFDLTIEAGETVALVGHTGAGKSSLGKLIARFYEFQGGQILIDRKGQSVGQDLRLPTRGGYNTTHRRLVLRWVWGSLWLGYLVVGLMACSLLGQPATPEPRPTLPLATLPASLTPRDLAEFYPLERASAERGREVYVKLCAECHGETGQGDGPRARQLGIRPADFTDVARRNEVPVAWYFRAISRGVVGTAMLSWETQLNEQQLWDVTFYTWSLASSPESIELGRRLYQQHCADCHGADGLGQGPRATTLDRSPTPLADPRYLAGRSGEELLAAIQGGVSGLDHDWSDKLTKGEFQAIINYLWTFLYD